MTWTTDASRPEEIALERAWASLNSALDHRVRVSVQMRVTACVFDALSFITVLREMEARELQQSGGLVRGARWDSRLSFQFAASLKAMYYFIRALQDAVYAALLEGLGNPAGAHASMQTCLKKPSNPVRILIHEALPSYFDWFADFRSIRNRMKVGLSTAFSVRGDQDQRQARLLLQEIDDAKRHVTTGQELGVLDVDKCLKQSAELLQFASDRMSRMARAPSRAADV